LREGQARSSTRRADKSTCNSLDEEPRSERAEAWKLKECFEHMCKHHPDATMAKMSIGKAYRRYMASCPKEFMATLGVGNW
jgi:hypothetical protein